MLKRVANPADNVPSEGSPAKRQRLALPVDLNENEELFANFPSEIVMAILRNLPSSDLLTCRQVNSQWNGISSRIMRQRADTSLTFEFRDVEFMHSIQYRRCEVLLVDSCKTLLKYGYKSLTDLVACLAEAKNFPFTNFRFEVDDLSKLENSDMRSFLAIWGKDILTLKLNVPINYRVNNFNIFKKLVFDKVSNLKKLEIDFSRSPDFSRLFTVRSIPISAADSNEFTLPHLEVLCVKNRYYDNGITEKIIRAAINLNDFEDDEEWLSVSDLQLFQSLDKLHCLKNVRIHISEQLISFWITSRTSFDLMKIQSLHLSFDPSFRKNEQLKSSAAQIVNQLVRSSKDVMHTLSTEKLGSLAIVIPTLNKLQKLGLQFHYNWPGNNAMLPLLFDLAGTFPNIKVLDVEDMGNDDRFTNQPLKIMSSVETLRIKFYYHENATVLIEQLQRITPNLKTLSMVNDHSFDTERKCPVDFGKISEYWPNLENFGWQICTATHRDLLHKLDAVITGFSEAFCKEYSEKFHSRHRLSANELAAAYDSELQNPSILDLKKLKRFDINLSMSNVHQFNSDYFCGYLEECSDEAGFTRDENMYFKTGLTKKHQTMEKLTKALVTKTNPNQQSENSINLRSTLKSEANTAHNVPSEVFYRTMEKLTKAHVTKTNQNQQSENSINLRSTLKREANPAHNVPSEESPAKRQRLTNTVGEIEKEKLIADLPSEIVKAILRNLPSSDLLTCRQVNRQWNEISSEIMRQRADTSVSFEFKDVEFMHSIQYRRCEVLLVDSCKTMSKCGSKSLTDLVECLAKSTNFPFTSFHFDDLSKFVNCDIRSFLAIWGDDIIKLNVSIKSTDDVRILKKLLFDRVPNLKKLTMDFLHAIQPSAGDSNEFTLPHLKVLCVKKRYLDNNGITEKIIRAAINLKNFEVNGGFLYVSDLQLFQSLDKLHCLKNVRIQISEELISFWITSRPSFDLTKIRSLHVSFEYSIWESEQLKSSAAQIVNQLVRSSKDVIHILSSENLGLLTELVIPKLNRLQKLRLQFDRPGYIAMFPPLFDLAGTFPNIKELHVDRMGNDARFRNYPLKIMSSVEILRIKCGYDDTVLNKQLMKITPNVKTLLMLNDNSFGTGRECLVDFEKISKYWPKLENLGWQVCIDTHWYLLHKLDAVITGFSETFCEKYSEKFLQRHRLSANEVAEYHPQRIKSSILDLKELKRFDINFSMSKEAYLDDKDNCDIDYLCGYSDQAG